MLPLSDPHSLVQALADKDRRIDAIRALVGGVTATELRTAEVTEAARDALLAGLRDPDPRVRWWCVQLVDHLPDASTLAAVVPLLDDPVPRVRRNAAHALGCLACKPGWDGVLPTEAWARLADLAQRDPNEKVRLEAARSLACTARAS